MGPRAGVDVFGKRKNFLPLPGLDPFGNLVTIPTKQPRLSSDSDCGNGNINNYLKKGCTGKSFAEQYAVKRQVILYLPKYKMTILPPTITIQKFGVTLYCMKNTFCIDVFLHTET